MPVEDPVISGDQVRHDRKRHSRMGTRWTGTSIWIFEIFLSRPLLLRTICPCWPETSTSSWSRTWPCTPQD